MVSVNSGALCEQQFKAIGSNFMAISKIINKIFKGHEFERVERCIWEGLEEGNGREKHYNQFVFSKIKYLLTVKEEDVVVVLGSKH